MIPVGESEITFKENLVLKKSVDRNSGDYFDENFNFSSEKFSKNVSVMMQELSDDSSELKFDIKGIDFSLANALRRIMIAEVPTVAIEKVHMLQNTSIIQDEVLAHRLGLIPIKIDPDLLNDINEAEEDIYDENNSIEFELIAKCQKFPDGSLLNQKVYSSQLKWIPRGNQAEKFEDCIDIPEKEILIAKLNPGQEINAKLICVKGYGHDHAKFSPVSTASYRLMPFIKINEPIVGEDAELFQSLFANGVIGLKNVDGEKTAFVDNVRLENGSRNYFCHEKISKKIEVGRISDHFIFCIESTGQLHPIDIFRKSIVILMNKCTKWIDIISKGK